MHKALLPADDTCLTRTGLTPALRDAVTQREDTLPDNTGKSSNANGTQSRAGTTAREDNRSDGELLAAFRNGDERGFVALYQRRHLEIFRYILRFVHGDEDMASDLFQETFIKIHEHAATLRNGDNVRSWMYAIARNNCLNHIKRHRRQVPLSEQHEQIENGEAPDELLHRDTLRGELDRAIHELPESQREAILLREFEGLSYAEIAEATHTNIGIIRQRLWRAKQALRVMLSPYFADGSSAGFTQVEDHE
ncbi:MAG: sigma-70 family RNA polymerase sigma factor [Bacteroidetes bacterium]|nr:sigma-70 family RNA polymerase sigma factor [Bacteroidota bacterium]